MKYSAFRQTVSDFVNRKDVTPSQLDFFVNNAKNELQMVQSFNFTRKLYSTTYPNTEGVGIVLPSDFKGIAGDYSVRLTTTSGAVIPLQGDSFANQQRRLQGTRPLPSWSEQVVRTIKPTITYYIEMRNEVRTLFLVPEFADVPLDIFYVSFIPDYGDDLDREDFLMKYGTQVLLWDALSVSNAFVSEEYKIAVNKELRNTALASLVDYDNRIPIDGMNIMLS